MKQNDWMPVEDAFSTLKEKIAELKKENADLRAEIERLREPASMYTEQLKISVKQDAVIREQKDQINDLLAALKAVTGYDSYRRKKFDAAMRLVQEAIASASERNN